MILGAPTTRHSRIGAVPVALGASLLLHAGLGMAIGLQAGTDTPHLTTDFVDFLVPEDPHTAPRVALGNPDSRTPSLTWIGYDEFEEMWAPESTIDQAQQSPQEPGTQVEMEEIVPNPDDQPVLQSEEALQESEEQPAPEPDNEPAMPAADSAPMEVAGPDADVDYARVLELVRSLEDLAPDLSRFNPIQMLRDREPARSAPRTESPEAPEPTTPANTAPDTTENAEPAEPAAPGQNAEPAEREADAATVNPVKRDDLGKPLAAQGLSIRTVRPTFSNVTLATARPRNPVAQIDFRRNGKPIRVTITRSSGHEQVDLDIRKALYSWRASGEPLLQLPDPEDPDLPAVVSIKLEILL